MATGTGGGDGDDSSSPLTLRPRMPKNLPSKLAESCLVHSAAAGVGGIVLGVGMGVFVATFSAGHGELIGSRMSEQLKHGFFGFWKQAIKRGYSTGKVCTAARAFAVSE